MLLKAAIGEPGKGGLCNAKVFSAQRTVTVFRVYNHAVPATKYGSWWSLSPPKGPRDKYARDNDVCPEWSPLDASTSCVVRSGTIVVMGTGQSAVCASPGTSLPVSLANQVYIPNDVRANRVVVEDCTADAAWP